MSCEGTFQKKRWASDRCVLCPSVRTWWHKPDPHRGKGDLDDGVPAALGVHAHLPMLSFRQVNPAEDTQQGLCSMHAWNCVSS